MKIPGFDGITVYFLSILLVNLPVIIVDYFVIRVPFFKLRDGGSGGIPAPG